MPKYNLMHKNEQLATLNISKPDGCINEIISIENKNKLPYGILSNNLEKTCSNMREWLKGRIIPMNRFNNNLEAYEFLHSINMYTFEWLSLQNHCVSLMDNYWIKKDNETLYWKDVNFYNNPMTPYIGKKLFFEQSKGLNYHSPDCTTNGQMQKKWIQQDGEYYLIKIPRTLTMDSTFNEVLVSDLLDSLNIPHVKYNLNKEKNTSKYYVSSSICKNFIQKGTEFIPASAILKNKPRNISSYEYFIQECAKLNYNITPELNKMLTIDYLTNNMDRHSNNFGLIRDAETFEILSFAPIFDNERSLTWKDKEEYQALANSKAYTSHDLLDNQNLNYTDDLSWLNFNTLENFPNIIDENIEKYEKYGMDSLKYLNVKKDFIKRINTLEEKSLKSKNSITSKIHGKEKITDQNITKKKNKQIICI